MNSGPRMLTLGVGLALGANRVQAADVSPTPPTADVGADELHAIDTVVVTGSRTARPLADTPVLTEVITREEIKQSGANSLGDLLDERPGLYVDRSFAGAGLQLQGLPPDYTLILVDGVRQPGRIGGVVDLDRFVVEDIERVEIVRGASSALYGSDAIAGVINIIRRRAARPIEISAQGSVGAHRSVAATAGVGVLRSRWSTRQSGGRRSSDGFDLDPSDVATSQSAFTEYNAANQTVLTPSDSFKLTASAEYAHRNRRAIDVSPAGGAVFDRENLTETASLLLKSEWQLPAASRLEFRGSLAVFRDQFLLDQRGSNQLDELQDTRERQLQLGTQLDLLLDSAHLTSFGAEGWYESLATARLVGADGQRARGAVYVQDEWTLVDAPLLILLPGARLDVDSQFGAAPTPRAALRFDPVEPLTLRASYGRGFKAPDFRELYLLFENPSAGYLVEGNSALEPETSHNVNLGAEYRAHRSVWISAQAFYNVIADRIGTDLAPSDSVGPRRFVYQNIASATSAGLETSVRLSPLTGLRLDLGYSFTYTENAADGQPLSGQPLHRATASLRYVAKALGFETSCRAAFVGSRPFFQDTDGDDVAERRNARGYASVDLRIAQRIGFGVATFLLAENLLDAGDAEFLALPPRSFSGGARLDY